MVAAAAQEEFASFAHDVVADFLEQIGSSSFAPRLEGLVLTGGCALNVLTNQRIYETLVKAGQAKQFNNVVLDLFVPSAPSDPGLSVGALWAVTPPLVRQPLQYVGFPLWDLATLDEEARRWGAKNLSSLGGVDYLAELLAGGPAWIREGGDASRKPIIAVVRGRQEFGPRALGHRSLLATPDSAAVVERMNRLKFRQWYRPVAPVVADEVLEEVFGQTVKSPYMTMAPLVRDVVRERFPALAHLDGTARHQSVNELTSHGCTLCYLQ
eukprot:TRINITY_DN72880_c0_g1_i1.p1 TRINITY_DN72880_c0_g1~~TRINITY_DN72880_c0_g1_i1.p1  ORF type:complete len:268 (-),score=42.80 TRINITY_DN72880_c0_g1_i1:38-841(-)